MQKTQITAHSGCENTQRDSLDAIAKAVTCQAEAVEMDVRLDGSGTLRVSHNCLTDEEYQGKPLFETVLAQVAPTKLRLNCDIKEQAALYRTIDMAYQYGLTKERLIITGCTDPVQLVRDPGIAAATTCFINLEEVIKYAYLPQLWASGRIADFATLMNKPWVFVRDFAISDSERRLIWQWISQLKVAGLNLPWVLASDEVISQARQQQIPLSVWTVDKPEEISRLLQGQVANITTLQPASAVSIRQKYMESESQERSQS